jgi:hypothetical protein
VNAKSRTFVASNVWVSPLVATRSPVDAMTSVRSVVIATRTRGLVGVMNGSPWLGRSNGTSRLTHGIQRWTSAMPLTRVNSQFEPVRRAPQRRRIGDRHLDRLARPEDPAERHADRLVVDRSPRRACRQT